MMLSDLNIIQAIQNGDLKIEPFNPEMIKPGSYTFTLGPILLRPKFGGLVDPDNAETFEYEEVILTENGYDLQPNEFILGQTAEKLSLSNKLASISDGRTLLARLGLQVILNSTLVEPGQAESQETLELKNSGPAPIRLKLGMPILKGMFFELKTPSARKYADFGTYAKQSTPRPQAE